MLAWQAKFEYKKEKVYQPTVESFNFVAANFCGLWVFLLIHRNVISWMHHFSVGKLYLPFHVLVLSRM